MKYVFIALIGFSAISAQADECEAFKNYSAADFKRAHNDVPSSDNSDMRAMPMAITHAAHAQLNRCEDRKAADAEATPDVDKESVKVESAQEEPL